MIICTNGNSIIKQGGPDWIDGWQVIFFCFFFLYSCELISLLNFFSRKFLDLIQESSKSDRGTHAPSTLSKSGHHSCDRTKLYTW